MTKLGEYRMKLELNELEEAAATAERCIETLLNEDPSGLLLRHLTAVRQLQRWANDKYFSVAISRP